MATSTSKPRPALSDSDSDSDSDYDISIAQDMEALRNACLLNPSTPPPPRTSAPVTSTYSISDTDTDLSDTDDIELARSIHRRFNDDQPVDLKPLRTLPPIGWSDEDSSDEEDDYETLRAIERRFAGFKTNVVHNTKTAAPDEPEVVQGSNVTSGKETSSSLPVYRKEASSLDGICHDSDEGFCSSLPQISSFDTHSSDQPFGSNSWHQQEASETPAPPSKLK